MPSPPELTTGAKVKRRLSIWFHCVLLGSHEWTCRAQQGVLPAPQDWRSAEAVVEYSRCYCARCGRNNRFNMKPPPK